MHSISYRQKARRGLVVILASVLSVLPGNTTFAQSSSGEGSSIFDFLTEGDFDPIIEGSYGYGVFDHKQFSSDLPSTGVVGLKLGFRESGQRA